MKETVVIFPNQLFEDHPALSPGRKVILTEEPHFFKRYNFHRKKLILHRASMRYYRDYLTGKGYKVSYVELDQAARLSRALQGADRVHVADMVDHQLARRLAKEVQKARVELVTYETPMFLTPNEWIQGNLGTHEHFRLESFYEKQRKRLGILLEDSRPVGGKWSFDVENRKSLPGTVRIPEVRHPRPNEYVREAVGWVESRFAGNYGSSEDFCYPVTHREALEWLADFLANRLNLFGDYQDAMASGQSVLFHSMLSLLLNTGLLTPKDVLKRTLAHAGKRDVPINSLEGFVRQLIGWRELVRAVYVLRGEEERKSNLFGHQRKIPSSFWRAETGIEPLDDVIGRLLRNAYAHHVERLMVLGSFMLLSEFDPDHVYRWFMELFIDAYDWVMVPNVYGLSQYADGGLLATKPYTSSSKYIIRMSNYKKGNWTDIWDGLYWRFLDKNRDLLRRSARMGLALAGLKRIKKDKLANYLGIAEEYLKNL